MNMMSWRFHSCAYILLALASALWFFIAWKLSLVWVFGIGIGLNHFARIIQMHVLILIHLLDILLLCIVIIILVLLFQYSVSLSTYLNPQFAWIIGLLHLSHEFCNVQMILFVWLYLLLNWGVQVGLLRRYALIWNIIFLQVFVEFICLRVCILIWHHDDVLLCQAVFTVINLGFRIWIVNIAGWFLVCNYVRLLLFLHQNFRICVHWLFHRNSCVHLDWLICVSKRHFVLHWSTSISIWRLKNRNKRRIFVYLILVPSQIRRSFMLLINKLMTHTLKLVILLQSLSILLTIWSKCL